MSCEQVVKTHLGIYNTVIMAVADDSEGCHQGYMYATPGACLTDEQPHTLAKPHLVLLVNGIWRRRELHFAEVADSVATLYHKVYLCRIVRVERTPRTAVVADNVTVAFHIQRRIPNVLTSCSLPASASLFLYR